MKKQLLIVSIAAASLFSCGDDTPVRRSRSKASENPPATDAQKEKKVIIDKDVLFGVIRSIPSPLETADLIHQLKVPFSQRILNDYNKKDTYTTSDKKALNLGIYGADLGYVNLYGEKAAAFNYLKAVRQIASDLKIGQFFDINTIKRMSANTNNLDSLLYISQRGFDQMNNYLEKQGRTDVSAQLLLGGWIEGIYLSTSVYKTNPDSRIMEAIGEQKVALEEIMIIIDAFRNERKFQTIIKGFDNLKTVYDDVVIEYIDEETEVDIGNGITQTMMVSKSKVKITPEQVEKVTQTIEELRASIID